MFSARCLRCRIILRQSMRYHQQPSSRSQTTHSFKRAKLGKLEDKKVDIDELLSKPTWSVRSLLPAAIEEAQKPSITPSQLHHLLRLSALPQPQSPKEEVEMLKTLQSQLHFVKEIQKVDTTGVEPLQAIRDETKEGIEEITIGMETLKDAFANEEVKGRSRRPRRSRDIKVDTRGVEDWNVLGSAERTAGKYFIVESSTSSDKS